jgi:hypothetical protein
MSIFDPKSVSHAFYAELFTKISINQLLAESGHCKLIKDMTKGEFISYQMYLLESVNDVQKPLKK